MHQVQRTSDRAEIRRRLNSDRVWSIYALADLDAELFKLCEWWTCGEGLALVFTGISILPIFVIGNQEQARSLLEALPIERGYLNLRDEHLPEARSFYEYQQAHWMRRMVVDQLLPRKHSEVVLTLGVEHSDEIQALYASGDGGGVAFGPFQLETGFFRGVRRNGELVAVAGVHVVSKTESVAGVGNIFTRADCRGAGLAQMATSAVVSALVDAGIETIGLNVEHNNAPAIAAYRRLGFRTAFNYWEGAAIRIGKTG